MTKATAKATTKSPRMSPKKWAEAEALWESGSVTMEDLVEKFGVSRQSLSRKFKLKGSSKSVKVEETKKAVAAEIIKTSIDEASILAARIKETKEQHYKMSSMIAQLSWQEILKAKNDGVPVATALNNLKALDTAMNIQKKAREERWVVLGLDKLTSEDDEGLPELVVSELTAEQIQELRDRDIDYMDEVSARQSEADGTEIVED
jgi:hypothetical protein